MRRFSALTATAVLATGLITGCGSSSGGGSGSSSSDYCKDLKSSAAGIKAFTADNATPDFAKVADFIDNAHGLAKKAPSDIKDDWATMVAAMDALTDALNEAGLKVEDIGTLMTGQLPAGADPSKLAGLTSKLQEIGSDKVQKAGAAIAKQAKDTCKIDLKSAG
ncbi:hypothetical protein [Nocardioides marmorisolisilvae]|uniref:Small secreted protein n=1 Tax=Nocardioides marmorisolisilvae TaxID=1542737 RepID=A0A3N0DUG2_9ACTN|nr:hypothetical protein [Nocardioides marmorisolisilvae]RNL79269.1 hypothetical protein EFL95_09670 [Nocardioides marmorisolisilvae]